MTTPTMDALDIIRKHAGEADIDFLRETLQVVLHAVMDADVSQRIGADLHERTPDRADYRNGYRPRRWDTRAGTLDLQIPKLRAGTYLPPFLDPRRRSEQALLAVIQQAYVEGVSTRRVEDLVQALGCDGISKSQVSRICQQLDAQVQAFRERPPGPGPVCVRLARRAHPARARGRARGQRCRRRRYRGQRPGAARGAWTRLRCF